MLKVCYKTVWGLSPIPQQPSVRFPHLCDLGTPVGLWSRPLCWACQLKLPAAQGNFGSTALLRSLLLHHRASEKSPPFSQWGSWVDIDP